MDEFGGHNLEKEKEICECLLFYSFLKKYVDFLFSSTTRGCGYR